MCLLSTRTRMNNSAGNPVADTAVAYAVFVEASGMSLTLLVAEKNGTIIGGTVIGGTVTGGTVIGGQ